MELLLIPLVLIIFVPGVIMGVALAKQLRKWKR